MSDNPFEEYVNGLESEEETPSPDRFGLRDIKITAWEPADEYDGEIEIPLNQIEIEIRGNLVQQPRVIVKVCPKCGLKHYRLEGFNDKYCAECGGELSE